MIRPLHPGTWLGAGMLLVLATLTFALTQADLLIVLVGGALFACLTMAAFYAPEGMFVALVVCSILVPLDLAVEPGPLPRIGPTRVLMGAYLAGSLLRVVIMGRLFERGRRAFPLAVPIGLWLAACLVSAARSVVPLVSVYAVVGREIIEQFLLFYLFVYFLNDPGFWPRLKKAIYVATALVCLFAYAEELAKANPLVPLLDLEDYQFRAGLLRVRATFFHPIALGCYILLVFPFAMADFLRERRLERRAAYLLLMVMMGLAAFFTVSRAPWICLVLEIAFMTWWVNRKNLKRFAFILVLAGIFMTSLVLIYQSSQTFYRLFRPLVNPTSAQEGSTEYYRWVVVRAIFERLTADRIAFGYGPNAFSYAGVEAEYSDHVAVLTAPDMHYARLAFEFGLVGLGLFCVLLFWLLVKALTVARRAPPGRKTVSACAISALLGFMVVNFTVSMFPMYPLGMLFWMNAALAVTPPDPSLSGGAS